MTEDRDHQGIKIVQKNKKAYYEYEILETFEAGLHLQGTEVKAIRDGKVSIAEAYAVFRGEELYLINLDISPYRHGNINNHEPKRPRKLLLHNRELRKLRVKVEEKGFTLVPTKLYFKRGWAKVEIALARGKTFGDKRQDIKKRTIERELRRQYGVK